ncbi:4'-phosphopantetheinyl transferase superfamily protein [Gillisia sp. M10.2A]|uniref:4'-phosphopantetheinyl transferase superfamily protein n=1 Tax=Gillisia lutea TaxID=2909668 RepID=A0ABS9EFD0_9FLAO|nr:4'-phosphopantetheinyl transferase superfamily protein [Gillisia lutea]MCF4101585.1 4'-phosphopantetheinyl transferase superfamily protein [Gillisia lutea]
MIGNDIIDLEVAASQHTWKRKGFLDKLYTPQEQEIILKSDSPALFVWALWAMKEASYKAHQRKFNLPRRFNPKDYCSKLDDIRDNYILGTVNIGECLYYTEVHRSIYKLHCIASQERSINIVEYHTSSIDSIKSHLITKISEEQNIKPELLNIQKNENFIPYASHNGKPVCSKFSISHHGKYSAYILALTNC